MSPKDCTSFDPFSCLPQTLQRSHSIGFPLSDMWKGILGWGFRSKRYNGHILMCPLPDAVVQFLSQFTPTASRSNPHWV